MTADRSWSTWGTRVHLLVTDPASLAAAEELSRAFLDAVDRACSRFRPDAELARVVPGRPTPVSPLLAAAVEAALTVAELTEGLVDPTLGRHLTALGYDRTFAALPATGPTAVALPVTVTWREVLLEGTRLTVPPGVQLDLGASAKAWAADHLAAHVAALGTGVLVNLGGDLALAGPAPEGGWSIEIADRPGAEGVTTVLLDSGGLATSSTTARTWDRGGSRLHHVLDPATGRPAPTVWASVSVVAGSCLEANACSTAAIVLGEQAPDWLAARGVPALLLSSAGEQVRVGGWPA